MQLRYNYRLYPTPGQQQALTRLFGCVRVVWNDALRARREAHKAGRPYITDAELSLRLTAAKRTPERAFLGKVSAVPLQQSLADLNIAYRNFFGSHSGRRKGPRISLPRPKSRKDRRQSARFTANARFKVLPAGRLRLPGIGDDYQRTLLQYDRMAPFDVIIAADRSRGTVRARRAGWDPDIAFHFDA